MELINILKEHSELAFTGRINFLDQLTGQFLGAFFLKNGRIVNAEYGGQSGEGAFHALFYQYFNGKKKLQYIPEPELIDEDHMNFNLSILQLKKMMQKSFENFKAIKKLEPARNLKLALNPDFISAGNGLTSLEYKILEFIVGSVRIKKIYDELEESEYEISNALISLRKKKALKVIQSAIIDP